MDEREAKRGGSGAVGRGRATGAPPTARGRGAPPTARGRGVMRGAPRSAIASSGSRNSAVGRGSGALRGRGATPTINVGNSGKPGEQATRGGGRGQRGRGGN